MVSGAGRCETVHPRQVFVSDREAHSSVYGDAPGYGTDGKVLDGFSESKAKTGRLSGGSLSAKVSGILVFCSRVRFDLLPESFNFIVMP